MNYTIEGAVGRFAWLGRQEFAGLERQDLIEHGFLLQPKGYQAPGKPIALTFMGLTHGNEWAGSAIVNGVLEAILAGVVRLPVPVAFILGNTAAALQNIRFIHRDLNRSFDRQESETIEDKRAREIETVLRETDLLVDFHQTMLPCDRAFFIFPYSKASFEFARAINPRQTTVTHWGKPFSADGRCTDEYVNTKGGVGISMETGQNGFDLAQIAIGVDAAIWAIREAGFRRGVLPKFKRAPEFHGDVMTFDEILPWPDGGTVNLAAGFTNFQQVGAGEVIGNVAGRAIKPERGGRIIFPKYLTPEQQLNLKAPPSELARFMRTVSEEELPN